MWSRLAVLTLVLVVVMAGAGVPATTARGSDDDDGGSVSPGASQSGDGSVEIRVDVSYTQNMPGSDGSAGSGAMTTTSQVSAVVDPVCWYEEGRNGPDMARYLTSAEYDHVGMSKHLKEMQGNYPNWQDHAKDTEGNWYEPTCSPSSWNADQETRDFVDTYLETNGPVWVEPGVSLQHRRLTG